MTHSFCSVELSITTKTWLFSAQFNSDVMSCFESLCANKSKFILQLCSSLSIQPAFHPEEAVRTTHLPPTGTSIYQQTQAYSSTSKFEDRRCCLSKVFCGVRHKANSARKLDKPRALSTSLFNFLPSPLCPDIFAGSNCPGDV